MSGHSKWSKVKHQKASTDASRSQLFTKASRMITVSVREGGGTSDPAKNFRLRLAMEHAKSVNMPKETIQRAIQRAADKETKALESLTYEAYGPGGVALLIEVTTDNRQRSVSQIKNVVERAGGSLASPGSVRFLFTTEVWFSVAISEKSSDEILAVSVDLALEDVRQTDASYLLVATPHESSRVREQLIEKGITVTKEDLVLRPISTIQAADKEVEERTLTIVGELEALDDVQRVVTNYVDG